MVKSNRVGHNRIAHDRRGLAMGDMRYPTSEPGEKRQDQLMELNIDLTAAHSERQDVCKPPATGLPAYTRGRSTAPDFPSPPDPERTRQQFDFR